MRFYSAQATDSRSAGTFKQPLFTDGTKTTCSGVETVDGTRYYADKVVLAAGAWSPTLIDLEDQCVSKVSPSNKVNVNSSLLITGRPGCSPISNSRPPKQLSIKARQ